MTDESRIDLAPIDQSAYFSYQTDERTGTVMFHGNPSREQIEQVVRAEFLKRPINRGDVEELLAKMNETNELLRQLVAALSPEEPE